MATVLGYGARLHEERAHRMHVAATHGTATTSPLQGAWREPAPPTPVGAPRDAVGTARVRRWFFWLAVALVLTPLATSLVHLLATPWSWTPVSDHALIQGQVAAVGRHAVALGPYSRLGFHFPGPALFYVLAIPYRLLGGASEGLLVGAVLVNAAAVVGLALVARRTGGLLLASIVLAAVACLMRSLGAGVLLDPWNPYVTILPFALLVLLAVGRSRRADVWMLPVAVGVASFVVQSHVGYAPVAVCLLVWAAAALAIRPSRPDRRRAFRAGGDRGPWWRPCSGSRRCSTCSTAATTSGSPSTTSRVGATTMSWGESLRVVGLQWSWRPEWLVGPLRPGLGVLPYRSGVGALVLVLLGVAATAVAWRLRRRRALLLAATLTVAFLAAIVSAHAVTGMVLPYLLRWTWVLGALLGVLCVWVASAVVLPRPLPLAPEWSGPVRC